MKPTGHEIVDRAATIDKGVLDFEELLAAPTDPQAFLDWMWEFKSQCKNCMLHTTRTCVVRGDGKPTAKVMVVGEGPGFLEDLTGLPLVGPMELRGSRCNLCHNLRTCYKGKVQSSADEFPGRRMAVTCSPQPSTDLQLADKKQFYLRSAGAVIDGIILLKWGNKYPRQNWVDHCSTHNQNTFAHSPFYFTNAVSCRSWDKVLLKDQTPAGTFVNQCRLWLILEWAAINPVAIIAMGKTALAAILKTKANEARVGEAYESKWGTILAMPHPAAVMREDNQALRELGYARIGETFRKALEIAGYAPN